MQLIVADTTPLNYLILIRAVESLPSLYQRVLIPVAVRAELAHPSAPNIVREWIARPSGWLEVASATYPIDQGLAHLDLGEREAISLASELRSGLLLMDERDGVQVARQRGLKVVGTLGVLDLAAERGLLDLRTMFDRLHETTFRSPLRIMSKMLEQDAERKRRDIER
jgi:predicted nucleic acid-binding protein